MPLSAPVNILYVVPHARLFGAAKSTLNTMKALDRELFSPHVLTYSDGPLREACAEAGIPFLCMPELNVKTFGKKKTAWFGALKKFSALLRRLKIGILDFTVHPFSDLKLMFAASRLASAKLVIRNRSVAPYLTLAEKFMVSRAELVISVGKKSLEPWLRPRPSDLWSRLRPERVHVIADGRELESLLKAQKDEALLRALGIPRTARTVGIIGTLNRNKRQERFLEMAAEIRRNDPHVWFLIVGSGESQGKVTAYEQELKELTFKLGLADRVVFTGYRDDVPALLKCLDVIVLTSDAEGLPGVLIEARAAGVPAVSVDVGAVREVVEDGLTGFVLGRWDARAAAEKVTLLLSDAALWAEISRRSRAGIEVFDFRNTHRRESVLYCSAAGIPVPSRILMAGEGAPVPDVRAAEPALETSNRS